MKRILVVMTSSPSSRQALRAAVDLAATEGARVCLVCVIPARMWARGAYEDWLDEVEATVPPVMRDGAVPLVGPAVQAVCAALRAYHPDLVVCGASVYDAFWRLERPEALFSALRTKLLVIQPFAGFAPAAPADSLECRGSP